MIVENKSAFETAFVSKLHVTPSFANVSEKLLADFASHYADMCRAVDERRYAAEIIDYARVLSITVSQIANDKGLDITSALDNKEIQLAHALYFYADELMQSMGVPATGEFTRRQAGVPGR